MPISPIIKITNFLNLLTGCLLKYVQQNRILSEEDYEKYILFSIIWSFGGVYEVPDRQLFHEYLWQKGYPIPGAGKENTTVFDYYIDDKRNIEWTIVSPESLVLPEKIQFS